MNVISIPLDRIEVSDRERAIDADWVSFLAASMTERGQDTPVHVRKVGRDKYALVAGGHRMAALAQAGIEAAFAIVVQANDLEAKLLEIDENLIRRELSPLDRATFLARRKAVYEKLNPETKHGAAPNGGKVANLGDFAQRFTAETAEKLGISERSIQRAVTRYNAITPDVRTAISGTWIAQSGSQLDALAKETPDVQRKIAEFIGQWPGVRQIGEIVRQINNRPKAAPPTKYDQFMAFWSKCDTATRMQIAEFVAPHMPGLMKEAA